jgi:ribokinase
MKQTNQREGSRAPKVVVVGSINCDLTTYLEQFPRENETKLGGRSSLTLGGKGLNQAVAAAQMGASVEMLASVGEDSFGALAKDYLQRKGIGTHWVQSTKQATTGTASILVDAKAQNMIAVAAGANAFLQPSSIYAAEALIADADLLIVQLEVPIETVRVALQIARHYGVMTLLNPAPAIEGSLTLLTDVTLVTPNETEFESLTGVNASNAIEFDTGLAQLRFAGAKIALVTRAERGCSFLANAGAGFAPAYNVNAVDPTGAGDVFNGVLGVSLVSLPRFMVDSSVRKSDFNFSLAELEWATRCASAAAAISVMRPLAQDAAPTKLELDLFMEQQQQLSDSGLIAN